MKTLSTGSPESAEKKSADMASAKNAGMWELPAEGFVRLKQILSPRGPIPVCRSTWWAGVASGRFPKPNKFFGSSISAWNVEDIRHLIAQATAKKLNE